MSQYYIGVKIIKAEPMSDKEFSVTQRGAREDEELRPDREGYKVTYPDGYISWSPKEVFESAYLPIGDKDNSVTQDMVDLFTGKEYTATDLPDGKSTLTSCKTASGFMLHEVSSCVDPANYDSIIGSEIGLRRIKDRMWSFLGFVVQWGKYGIHLKGCK